MLVDEEKTLPQAPLAVKGSHLTLDLHHLQRRRDALTENPGETDAHRALRTRQPVVFFNRGHHCLTPLSLLSAGGPSLVRRRGEDLFMLPGQSSVCHPEKVPVPQRCDRGRSPALRWPLWSRLWDAGARCGTWFLLEVSAAL